MENQLGEIQAPSISKCNGINPEWVEKAMPWAAHLKKACPTAYTFPYDDQTSTFNCNTKPSDDADEDEDYVNTQSCEWLLLSLLFLLLSFCFCLL